MTSPPHCFSAHVDGGLPGGQRLQLFNRFRELIRFHIVGITPERTVSPAAVPGVFLCLSPAATAFYMNISYAVFCLKNTRLPITSAMGYIAAPLHQAAVPW